MDNSKAQQPLRDADRQDVVAAFIGRVALLAAGVDAIYFLFFLVLDSPILAWINVFSVALYLGAYALVKRRRLHLAALLIWLEAFPHAAFGTMMLGWESGFHYLLLMFIPSVVMTATRRRQQLFVSTLLAFLILLDVASRVWGPLAPIPQAGLLALKWLNLSIFVIMFSALAAYYRQKIMQAERRLKVLATVDALTGLNNRRQFESDAQAHIARFERSGVVSSLVITDIDFFKHINDTVGHEGGDRVLVAIGQLFKRELREVDSLARWGGEEFVFLMHDTDLAQALEVTERIRRDVEVNSVSLQAADVRCTMSFGVTQLVTGDSLESALARADRALYLSKTQGRNRVNAA